MSSLSTVTPDAELQRLMRTLREALRGAPGKAELVGPSGDRAELPQQLYRLLLDAMEELERGNAVSVLPLHHELTTQQAADVLNMSRPYLVRLLEAGEIPFRKVGTHRRISLQEVQRYRERRLQLRKDTIAELANEAQTLGFYC